MIAGWMCYAIAVGAVVSAAAWAVERAMHVLRRPVRFVWLSALVATVGLSVVRPFTAAGSGWIAPLPSPRAAAPQALLRRPAPVRQPQLPSARRPQFSIDNAIAIPRGLDVLNIPLLGFWIACSLLGGTMLLLSTVRLRKQQAKWRPNVLEGVPIYVSHDVGPALFGIGRYSIVVPEWVLGLDEVQRKLIIAHEREHARAADPIVLLVGALTALLLPWNPAAWIMFRRLRFAIESDCDWRLIGHSTDVRAYGELLLTVSERVLLGAMPAAALSESPSFLERRLTLMTALPVRQPALRSLGPLLTSGALVVAACALPRPEAASRADQGLSAPQMNFVQYRWIADAAVSGQRYVDQNGKPITLGDSVVLDMGGIDSAWVAPRRAGPDSSLDVVAVLNPHGAAVFGATTATHVGKAIAVVIDGRIVQVATVNSSLGPLVPIASVTDRQVAESLAVRVNQIARELRPMYHVEFGRPPVAEVKP